MKKFLNISVIAALAVLPLAANAATGDIVTGSPTGRTAQGVNTTIQTNEAVTASAEPKYALAVEGANDGNVATAGYVKGAYNAAIKAINKVSDTAGSAVQGVKVNGSELSKDANGKVDVLVTEGSANGTISVNNSNVAVHGLGSAAYVNTGDLAGTAGTYSNSTSGLTATTIQAAIDEVASTAGSAANQDLSNLSGTGKSNVSAQGTVDLTKNDYGTGTVGKALVDIKSTADSAADKDLSNLSSTGTGVITTAITNNAAGATYSNTASGLTATTLQDAIDELATNAGDYATQDGVENTIETATITATVPTLTVWNNDNSASTVGVTVSSIVATYAEPSNP